MELEPGETYDASGDDHEDVIGALHQFAGQEGSDETWDVALVVDGDEVKGELVEVLRFFAHHLRIDAPSLELGYLGVHPCLCLRQPERIGM